MTSFLSVEIPDDADLAMIWAVEREFDLRMRRRRIHEIGLVGVITETLAPSFERLRAALGGLDEAVNA
jgi:hypothetical protein